MTTYVLDAGVAAKWFLPPDGETQIREALRLLDDYVSGSVNLMVPDLFWPEFGSILWKAVRRGRISLATAEESIVMLQEREIATVPTAKTLGSAFGLATAFNRTVYDAVYVALALLSDAQLLTADERLANALAARFPVRWLGAYCAAG